eukprot:173748_1
MQFQVCLIGNSEDTDEKSECCYIYGNWDPSSTSCIGLICENGMFEYRDIYTNTFVRYQLINKTNHEIINKSWLHFIFINPNQLLFTFEDHKTIYKTSYRRDPIHHDLSIFPNNITQKDLSALSFDIELRFECSDFIQCFDIDVHCQHILCGLSNGDVLIGSIHHANSNQDQQTNDEDEEEEPLILISNCHQSEITAICGSLLNAFISSGSEGDVKVWDLNIYNTDDNHVSLLHRFDDIGTTGITSIYPFRCALTNNELVAISTVEGVVFVYSLNNECKLLNILHTKHQSEILDISSMTDGLILSVSTLNGFVYLFDTVHFNEISFQKLSAKPIVFAQYKSNNNDFMWLDCDGMYQLYPQTRTNTEYTQSNATITDETVASSDRIPSIPTSVSSPFTMDTPIKQRKNKGKENVFSQTTISSNNTPFHLVHRDRNIINPLKTTAVLNQMKTMEIDPLSVAYSKPKASSISKYYEQKMKSIENTKFDPKSADHQQKLNEIQKKHLKRIKMEEERRKNMHQMYRSLPKIPSKGDIIIKQLQKKQNKIHKAKSIGIEPSIKPFIKRSLQPERQRRIERKSRRKRNKIRQDPEGVNQRKTISFTKKMTFWSNTTFNQCQ